MESIGNNSLFGRRKIGFLAEVRLPLCQCFLLLIGLPRSRLAKMLPLSAVSILN